MVKEPSLGAVMDGEMGPYGDTELLSATTGVRLTANIAGGFGGYRDRLYGPLFFLKG